VQYKKKSRQSSTPHRQRTTNHHHARIHTTMPSKSRNKSAKRALNAFAIASGDHERSSKQQRRRHESEDEEEASVDGGSDSEGNEWKLGEVDEDDDSDIDSDEAMGESDEERFEDFTFRGSEGGKKKKVKKVKRTLDLEEDAEEEEEEDSDTDMEGWADLSEMMDRVSESEEEEQEKKPKKGKRKRAAEESEDEVGDFGQGSSDSEEEEDDDDADTEDSDSDEEENPFHEFGDEEEEDELKLEALESAIASLPDSLDRPTKRARIQDPNEAKAPGEYNLALTSSSQKLTIADLLPSVADPALKKSLKLLASDAKSSSKGGVPGKLSAPLAKRLQDRIDRAAAYDQTKETLKRWVDTVKHNREAEHLHFPLANAPNAPVVGSKKLVPITAEKPLNDFEASINNILKESNMASEKQIQEFEELATQKMSIEDVQRRTAELRMARELMYRQEVKAKRLKKIKSKSYHRIKKKERLREQQAIEAALAEERGGEPDSEEEMERERKRAEERMSLKHKQSRWAKGVKESGRGAWDADARHGALEMAQRSEDLRRKIQGKTVGSDGESSSEEESDDEFDEEGEADRKRIMEELEKLEQKDAPATGKASKLMAMKFMQNAEAAKRKENEAMIQSLKDDWEDAEDRDSNDESDEEVNTTGRMVFKPGKPEAKPANDIQERSEFEAPPGSDDEDEQADDDEVEITNKAASTAPQRKNPFSAPKGSKNKSNDKQNPFTVDTVGEEEEANPWLPQDEKSLVKTKAKALTTGKQEAKRAKSNYKLSKDRKTALDAAQEEADGDTNVTIDTNLTLKVARLQNSDDEGEHDDETQIQLIPTKGKKAESQRELVKMAFAGDNVVQEFKKEKKQIAEEDDDQVIDQTLPGWGTWAGSGLTKKQKNQNARRKKTLLTIKGVSQDKRKDAKLEKVIISEKRDKKVCVGESIGCLDTAVN
jgi:U3 small nucleolar RNA-associated protein 14